MCLGVFGRVWVCLGWFGRVRLRYVGSHTGPDVSRPVRIAPDGPNVIEWNRISRRGSPFLEYYGDDSCSQPQL